MGNVELAINHNAERHQTKNYRAGNKSTSQANARQPFSAAMVLGNGLKHRAPPKVPVDLDVPLFPTRIDRVAPAFFFEQLENRTEQMMSILSVITPKNPST